MISVGSQLPPTPQNALTSSAPAPDAFPNPQSLPKTSVLFVLHHPSAHRRRYPHGHHPVLPTLMVEGSTQAAPRQEKSLKSSRISNVLHAKASPKAGKAAARKGRPIPNIQPCPSPHLSTRWEAVGSSSASTLILLHGSSIRSKEED